MRTWSGPVWRQAKPLFLYLSYNTPHSPAQPEEEWKADCDHIKHHLRKLHCAMVVGLDRNFNTAEWTTRSLRRGPRFTTKPPVGESWHVVSLGLRPGARVAQSGLR